MAVQVVQYIRIGLVFNLVVRHKGNIADIAGRHHDIARGAVHVLKPFEEAGVFQGNHPDQLSVYLLDDRDPQDHLAAQPWVFAYLFIRKLPCKAFVHNGKLVQGKGLDRVGEL